MTMTSVLEGRSHHSRTAPSLLLSERCAAIPKSIIAISLHNRKVFIHFMACAPAGNNGSDATCRSMQVCV